MSVNLCRESVFFPFIQLGYNRRSSMHDRVRQAISTKMHKTKQNNEFLFKLLRYEACMCDHIVTMYGHAPPIIRMVMKWYLVMHVYCY